MKIVVWNCADAFARKAGALDALGADLAVVPECRAGAIEAAGLDSARVAWIGQGKGVAVIGGKNWTVEAVPISVDDRWFLPAIARSPDRVVQIIGLWVKPRKGYVVPSLEALKACAAFIRQAPTIIAGDFNQNVSWDRGKRKHLFSDLVTQLESLGYASAWHTLSGERHGAETTSTLYFRRDRARGYHIDYVFLPRQWHAASVEVGDYESWVTSGLSDHVPVRVTIDWS